MEFFKDRNILIAIAIFVVAVFLGSFEQGWELNLEGILSIATSCFFLSVMFYFLKFVSDGIKVNRKPPYNEIPLSVWGYVWRVGIICWLFMFSMPVLLFIPENMIQVFLGFWFLVINNFLIFLCYCRNKKEKIQEIKYLFSGLSF